MKTKYVISDNGKLRKSFKMWETIKGGYVFVGQFSAPATATAEQMIATAVERMEE